MRENIAMKNYTMRFSDKKECDKQHCPGFKEGEEECNGQGLCMDGTSTQHTRPSPLRVQHQSKQWRSSEASSRNHTLLAGTA